MVGCVIRGTIWLAIRKKKNYSCRQLKLVGRFVCKKPVSIACPSLTLMLEASHVCYMTRRLCRCTGIGQVPLILHITNTVLMVSYVLWCRFPAFLFPLCSKPYIALSAPCVLHLTFSMLIFIQYETDCRRRLLIDIICIHCDHSSVVTTVPYHARIVYLRLVHGWVITSRILGEYMNVSIHALNSKFNSWLTYSCI